MDSQYLPFFQISLVFKIKAKTFITFCKFKVASWQNYFPFFMDEKITLTKSLEAGLGFLHALIT